MGGLSGGDGFPRRVTARRYARRVGTASRLRRDTALVGNAGWKGEPVDGAAELGYAVAPSRRGRGIATAVRELVARASVAGLRTVVAHTLAEPSPSTSVLARCGFAKVAEVVDPNDGPIWRWELSLPDT